jgi:hypothetical protein
LGELSADELSAGELPLYHSNAFFAVTNNGSGQRKVDLGEEGRLKFGPVKRKSKSSRPSFDQVRIKCQSQLSLSLN